MRLITKGVGGAFAVAAALSLAACGGGEEADADNTVVTDVDPLDGNAVDDTTAIDATLGAEESMGMENAMPADSAEPAAADDGDADGEEADNASNAAEE